MIVYQLRCGLILTGMQSTIRFVRQVCPTCGLVLGRREADRLSEDHLYTPQTENIKKIIYKYVDLYNLHIHINIHACIFMHRSLCSNMFPFFSGSGSSSVLNFTEEGASMPSERADHSIVNYHDETPGAVDDVLTVRALVSNNFDTFVGEKNQQYRSDLVIWWWFDCFFGDFGECIYIYIYIEVISWVTSGGDFSFNSFAKSVSAGFWMSSAENPGLRWISNHLGILCQNSHWVPGAGSGKNSVPHGTKIPFSKRERESC